MSAVADPYPRILLSVGQRLSRAAGGVPTYAATVRDVTAGRPAEQRSNLSALMIPVGGSAFRAISLPPGRYIVEATSPSGGRWSEEIELEAGAPPREIILQSDDIAADFDWQSAMSARTAKLEPRFPQVMASPAPARSRARHGWLIFAALLAVLCSIPAVVRHLDGRPLSPESAAVAALGLTDVMHLLVFGLQLFAAVLVAGVASKWIEDAADIFSRFRPILNRRYRSAKPTYGYELDEAMKAETAPPKLPAAPRSGLTRSIRTSRGVHLTTSQGGANEWLDVFGSKDPDDALLATEIAGIRIVPGVGDGRVLLSTRDPHILPGFGNQLPAASQFWVTRLAQNSLQGQAVRLPWPWRLLDSEEDHFSGEVADFEIALGGEFGLSLAVKDARFAPLLGYLGSGRITEAAALLEPSREVLFRKFENEYLAAAGCYVLIASKSQPLDADWRGWLENLDRSFSRLADAAILQGYSLLQQGDGRCGAKLLEAYRRGVPVFTQGVRMLRDGLTFVAAEHPDDIEIAQALKHVSALGRRCNPQQVFTCIRF